MKSPADRFPVRGAEALRPDPAHRVQFHPPHRRSLMDPTGAMETLTAYKLPAGAFVTPIRFDVTDIRIHRFTEEALRPRFGMFLPPEVKVRGYRTEITATVLKTDGIGSLTFSRDLYIIEPDWYLPEEWTPEEVNHFFEAEAVAACIRFAFAHELTESFFASNGRHLIEPHGQGKPPGTWERAGDSLPDRDPPVVTVDILRPGD